MTPLQAASATASLERLAIMVGVLATLAGVLTGVGATWYLRLKDRREAKAQKNDDVETMITVKDATIASLEKQSQMLLDTIEAERAETKEQAARQRDRAERIERRLEELERDYRNLVLTVTTMGFCANASTCPNNDPGDRRAKVKAPLPGLGG